MSVKLAIAVQKYHHPGQTFVNRHLAQLFGGTSCVIAERHYREIPSDQRNPNFVFADHLFNPRDIVQFPFYAFHNMREHGSLRVPYGQHRARLIAFIQDQGVNAILSEFGSQSMLVSDVGRELGLPVFCYFRGRDATRWVRDKTRIRAYQRVFGNLAGVFAVSQFLLDNLASVGLTHENAHVVPSGTDIELFRPAQKDPNLVLAVGRLVDKKAPDLTIRAIVHARAKNPDLRLEMIGGGPLLKKTQALVNELGAGAFITLHGAKDSTFIAERLSRASLFVQHSVTDKTGEAEGLPSSIQEAFAAGCPVVSTRHAGIPELVQDGVTGYLADEHDLDGYTRAIETALSSPSALGAMGMNARKMAEEKIDYRLLYAKVEQIIEQAANETALPNS